MKTYLNIFKNFAPYRKVKVILSASLRMANKLPVPCKLSLSIYSDFCVHDIVHEMPNMVVIPIENSLVWNFAREVDKSVFLSSEMIISPIRLEARKAFVKSPAISFSD